MTLVNASSLFLGSRKIPAYHEAIAPCPKVRARLVAADKKIRDALRAAAKAVSGSATALNRLGSREFRKSHSSLTFELRFLWQGSWVYDTAVDPARCPPQQSDLDDGTYVRTSFLGRTDPAIASAKMFQFTEAFLQPLCEREGWTLDKTKDTCVRVIIDDKTHIDIPLYAIPDDEFSTLEKAALRTFGTELALNSRNLHAMLDQEKSLRIPHDRVMLAHRTEGWIASDPRALHDWFIEQTKVFGPQLRRTSRYLKGWRDFEFDRKGPESITLMVCAVNAFRILGDGRDESRDDATLLAIAKQLPDMFRGRIANPVLPVEAKPMNEWDDVARQRYIKAAEKLYDDLERALNKRIDTSLVVEKLIEVFGERLPNRPDLVKIDIEKKSAEALPVSSLKFFAAPLILAKPTTSG